MIVRVIPLCVCRRHPTQHSPQESIFGRPQNQVPMLCEALNYVKLGLFLWGWYMVLFGRVLIGCT